MAINRISPKKGKVVDIPDAPTIGTATAGPASATVAFTAATIGGPATTYTTLSSPGSITGTGSSSPITVSGLTAGTAYTFTVRGANATGNGEYSSTSNSIIPTVATAYESIATLTGNGSSGTITFSSIPSTYKHLQIRGNVRSTRAGSGYDWFTARLNGDSGTNYSYHIMMGQGSAPYIYGIGSNTSFYVGALSQGSTTAQMTGVFVMDIPDYQSTSKNKTMKTMYGHEINASNTESHVGMISGGWYATPAAIDSVSFIIPAGGAFDTKTTISLYGIKG